MTGKTPIEGELFQAMEIENKGRAAAAGLMERRRQIPCSDKELYTLLRSREYLPAEAFVGYAEQAVQATGAPTGENAVPILLSGIVPEPMDLFDTLNELGATTVADDFIGIGRRLYPAAGDTDPYLAMARSIVHGPPDSTKGSPFEKRLEHVLELARTSGAKGVVFYHLKFCEPEQFYLPALKSGLEANGLPCLTIETDLGSPATNQVVTRLEAFLEMIS